MFHCRIAAMDDCETPARLRLQMRSERDPTFTEEALPEHIFACLRAQGWARVMLNASPTGELLCRSLGFRQSPNEFEYIL